MTIKPVLVVGAMLCGMLFGGICSSFGQGRSGGAAAATGGAATTIYLAPNGKDTNPGTRNLPRQSFVEAFEALKPGQALVLLPGDYLLADAPKINKNKGKAGTEAKPITVRGEGKVRLYSHYPQNSKKPQFKIFLEKSSYITFENIEFDGGCFACGKASHITWRNCQIHDYSNYGIITNQGEYLTIENCVIHGSKYEHGIYFTGANNHCIVRGTTIYDTAVSALHINHAGNHDFVIENCRFFHNSREWGPVISMYGSTDLIVRNNIFYANLGHIFTILPEKGHEDAPRRIRILNNTIYQPPGGRQGKIFAVQGPLIDFTVRNNVIVSNCEAIAIDPNLIAKDTDFDYNIYGKLSGDKTKELGLDQHSVFNADVSFVSAPGRKDKDADLQLAADSAGATGAPLLELVPDDIQGNARKPGGAFGAYATPAK